VSLSFPEWIGSLDSRITAALPAMGRAGNGFWKLTTCGGYAELWGIVYVALIAWPPGRWLGWQLAGGEFLGMVLLIPLRYLFRRARPSERKRRAILPIPWERYSFPSSHAIRAVCAATVLGLNYAWVWPVALPLALLVAASRVVLRRHYASDVIAGVVVGVCCGLAAGYGVPYLTAVVSSS